MRIELQRGHIGAEMGVGGVLVMCVGVGVDRRVYGVLGERSLFGRALATRAS